MLNNILPENGCNIQERNLKSNEVGKSCDNVTEVNGSDKQMGNLRNDGQVKQVIYGDNGVKIVSGNEVYMGCDNATEDNGSGKRMGNLRNDGQLKQVNYGDNGVKKNSGNEVYMGCDKSSTSCAVIEVECGKDDVEMDCDSHATINGGGNKTGNIGVRSMKFAFGATMVMTRS